MPTSPCTNPYGDYFLGISLRNKQDYARLHGYELHLMAESVDATVRAGPWQKVALLHQVRACGRAAMQSVALLQAARGWQSLRGSLCTDRRSKQAPSTAGLL